MLSHFRQLRSGNSLVQRLLVRSLCRYKVPTPIEAVSLAKMASVAEKAHSYWFAKIKKKVNVISVALDARLVVIED